ncbi:hypothetical protein I3843_15G159700 [Carya illinoinensis]|uniref:Uncharacterized protein n=1 Tax=Carya illinoinensis TaxID=32201 RepID=A0A922DC37_CARIL|nr:hypothetical protein I3760_15G165400 [Carya illinoinensis]KAG6676765.1 hypothetical protein I3842_15G168100 [Carya illinoinensis]KAG7945579.1 hypothetical protein I3843_15G159700 [Carya illinoinensis]
MPFHKESDHTLCLSSFTKQIAHKVSRSMHSMASSSHKSNQDYKLKAGEDEGGDWLELGLGLGFGTGCRKVEAEQRSNPVSGHLTSAAASSSSSLPLQTNQQIGLGLGLELQSGLGLGFENEGVRHVGLLAPSISNYQDLSWPDHCYHYNQYYDNDEYHYNGVVQPSWPWHSDPAGAFLGLHDLQMPVPNDSHNYSTRRPHSGLWFSLRSSTNRDGEALPQIPKAYIRVKDENVTVFMVKKYLVTKLGLSNEAEIDISCMGQNLLHTQTLKEVRDAVWVPRLLESVNSTILSLEDYSLDMSSKHLMSLHYERRSY